MDQLGGAPRALWSSFREGVVKRYLAAGLLTGAMLVLGAAPAGASPYIHAHRGGAITAGKPVTPENTMPTFEKAAAQGFVLELDVKLTQDNVPVVIHDATLDRTTDCTGLVADKTLAQLASCQVDMIGVEGNQEQLPVGDPRRSSISTLSAVLDLLKATGASANIEIKNIPTDPDFDPTYAYADTVTNTIKASGVPSSQLIIQSFTLGNLEHAKVIMPDVDLSILTLNALNEAGLEWAGTGGFQWVSPQWPVDQNFISRAHRAGFQVVPWTIDTAADMKTATKLGSDAIITNDPTVARTKIASVIGKAPKIPKAPSKKFCRRRTIASGTIKPAMALLSKKGARKGPRVFAMQFKQDIANVKTYSKFRRKIECMIRRWVVPNKAKKRPNVVAFNEDVGLATLGTGTRGAATRKAFKNPTSIPGCAEAGSPCGALSGLTSIGTAYSQQTSAYDVRFGPTPGLTLPFIGATDTLARGWMQVFSDMARRYHLYMVGSSNQAPFRESLDPAEIATFEDPDLAEPKSVYVATDPEVYNQAFMWGPKNVRREGPRPLKNVVAQNRKVPLTSIEQALGMTPGPATGADAIANLRPYRLPGTKARVGFATSLPAFEYGYQFGDVAPAIDPCGNVAVTYMRCLNALGANLVMQDEANPGAWAGDGGAGAWQPLEWMGSTWRAVADSDVGFTYNVTPHMVGNLGDLPFDGQTAITQRGLNGPRKCTYVGNRTAQPEDEPPYLPYVGPKREFLALIPWVKPDTYRSRLRLTSAKLVADSGSRLENRYVETAAIADLPFPPKAKRANCVGVKGRG